MKIAFVGSELETTQVKQVLLQTLADQTLQDQLAHITPQNLTDNAGTTEKNIILICINIENRLSLRAAPGLQSDIEFEAVMHAYKLTNPKANFYLVGITNQIDSQPDWSQTLAKQEFCSSFCLSPQIEYQENAAQLLKEMNNAPQENAHHFLRRKLQYQINFDVYVQLTIQFLQEKGHTELANNISAFRNHMVTMPIEHSKKIARTIYSCVPRMLSNEIDDVAFDFDFSTLSKSCKKELDKLPPWYLKIAKACAIALIALTCAGILAIAGFYLGLGVGLWTTVTAFISTPTASFFTCLGMITGGVLGEEIVKSPAEKSFDDLKRSLHFFRPPRENHLNIEQNNPNHIQEFV